jgi:hypothetical protein
MTGPSLVTIQITPEFAPSVPSMSGFAARLAAKVGLHTFCIWLNGQFGRAPLAFANLIDW